MIRNPKTRFGGLQIATTAEQVERGQVSLESLEYDADTDIISNSTLYTFRDGSKLFLKDGWSRPALRSPEQRLAEKTVELWREECGDDVVLKPVGITEWECYAQGIRHGIIVQFGAVDVSPINAVRRTLAPFSDRCVELRKLSELNQ